MWRRERRGVKLAPGVGRVVDGECAAVIPVAELSRPTLAVPVMLSELPDTAGGRQRGSSDGAGGCERCAGDCARGVHAVVNTSVQFTSLRSSWSQPSVAEPVRVSESASRSVTETDSPSKAEALICVLQVQRARRLLHQPGDRAAEARVCGGRCR